MHEGRDKRKRNDTRERAIRGLREAHRARLLELTGRDFPEVQARRHVRGIEAVHDALERALGRPVRFEVAVLDYFTSGSDPIAPELRLLDREALDRLLGLVRTDPLTGTLNRRGLEPVLAREVARAGRSQRPLALLAVDLDDFKRVNDRHGHPWGDRVLVRLAEVLAHHCRASDAVARLGGDEFVVVLPDTSLDGARVLGDRIREAVARTDLLGGCPTRAPDERITISVGVASGALPREDLVAQADRALYAAKRAGRNRSSSVA